MSKAKRTKSGSAGGGGTRWDQAIVASSFDEETWQGHVTMLVGSSYEDEAVHLDALHRAVCSGQRRLFTSVSRRDLFALVNELGSTKGKAAKGVKEHVPAHSEVCEAVKNYLDTGEDVPLSLLAKLIKWRLLDIKSQDLRRRETEAKVNADRAKRGSETEKPKSPVKKGGKKTPEPAAAKEGSKLHKRGDEDHDKKFIDDEPDDGAQHYIFLHGFYHPHMACQLADVGINVDAILRIVTNNYDNLATLIPTEEADNKQQRVSTKLELKRFWRDMLMILQRQADDSKLHDVALLEYAVDPMTLPNKDDTEQKVAYGLVMFEDIAVMIYDLLDAKRQYQNYLHNLRLIHLPVYGESSIITAEPVSSAGGLAPSGPAPTMQGLAPPSEPAGPDMPQSLQVVDLRYYNDLISSVPPQAASVPVILHCMLEQVVATEEGLIPPSERKPAARVDGMNSILAAEISNAAHRLALSEEEQALLSGILEFPQKHPEQPRYPILVNTKDDIGALTRGVTAQYGLNLLDIEQEMLQMSKMNKLVEKALEPQTLRSERERSAQLQELIYFCTPQGVSSAEIDHAFKQFVLENMCLTMTETDGALVQPVVDETSVECRDKSVIAWDDPYPVFSGLILDDEKMAEEEERKSHKERLLIDQALAEPATITELLTPVLAPEPISDDNLESSTSKRQSRSKRKSSKSEKSLKDSANCEGKTQSSVKGSGSKAEITGESSDQSRASSASSDKRSILKSRSQSRSRSHSASTSSKGSRPNSVHFDDEKDAGVVSHVDRGQPDGSLKSSDVTLAEILNGQCRSLDEWCFAEHLTPDVLAQELRAGAYERPYVDTYYNRRDHSLMLTTHHPYNDKLCSETEWHSQLHSNLGFRNYLIHVAPIISAWVKSEEAKFEADQLIKELDRIRSDEVNMARLEQKRSKSARKSASRSPKGSRGSSVERPGSAESSNNIFLRPNSLKALREERERLQAEEDEKERVKNEKRVRSASKKSPVDKVSEKGAKDDKKRPGSRGSSKSKTSKSDGPEVEEATDLVPVDEMYWPFTGYDVGNKLVHVKGKNKTMFPVDGGQIRTETTDFIQGPLFIKTSVLKDGHVFLVHLLDPREDDKEEEDDEIREAEKQEEEEKQRDQIPDMFDTSDDQSQAQTEINDQQQPTQSVTQASPSLPSVPPPAQSHSAAGSFTAQLCDGMHMAFSSYGPTGQSLDGQKYEPEPYVPIRQTPSPVVPQAPSPSKPGKKGDKGKDKAPTPEPQPEEDVVEEVVEEAPVPHQPFQTLYLTCPDGLIVRYMLESHIGVYPTSDNDRRLIVKLTYSQGKQVDGLKSDKGTSLLSAVERAIVIETEFSRTVTSEGTVVRHLQDGNIQVLYASGMLATYSQQQRSSSDGQSRCNSVAQDGGQDSMRSQAPVPGKDEGRESPGKKSTRGGAKKTARSGSTTIDKPAIAPVTDAEEKAGVWTVTSPHGDRYMITRDGSREMLRNVMVCMASDPETKQTMATRDDHVIMVSHPDGMTITEHSDGTRITTYYRESQLINVADEAMETGEATQCAVQLVKFVRIECPGYATVEFNCETSESLMAFGNGSSLNVFPDGYYMLHHWAGGRLEVEPQGIATYFPQPDRLLQQLVPEKEISYVMAHNSHTICEVTDTDSNIFTVRYNGECSMQPDPAVAAAAATVTVADGDSQSDDSSSQDLISVGSGTGKVTHFRKHVPHFYILHADGSGTRLLRYDDIAEYIAQAEQEASSVVLRDPLPDFPAITGITLLRPYKGKASQNWNKPYELDSIIPHGIRSRDLTTLRNDDNVQPGPQFGRNVGNGLHVADTTQTASTLVFPVIKCPQSLEVRQLVQYPPITPQLRSQLQKGLKEYAEYVKARHHAAELVKCKDPRDQSEKDSAARLQDLGKIHDRLPQYQPFAIRQVYEELLTVTPPSPPPTPQPRRTKSDWERDLRELQEEQEGRAALRNNKIPPYFESELGKAFLLTQTIQMGNLLEQLSAAVPAPKGLQHDNEDSDASTPLEENESPSDGNNRRSQLMVSQMSDASIASTPANGVQMKQSAEEFAITPVPRVESVPSATRPANPTPGHAIGHGSPSPLRPKNPTPAEASRMNRPDRPGNPTPNKSSNQEMTSSATTRRGSSVTGAYHSVRELPIQEEGTLDTLNGDSTLIMTRSLLIDAAGQPRQEAVHLPNSIKGGRPGAMPNVHYQAVEEPVRRKVYNAGVIGATIRGQQQIMQLRGLTLLPDFINFGVLREGNTYATNVQLRNTGVDSCRFKVRQPPPATGIRILYKPGPIAAGMRAELTLEVYAVAVGVQGEEGIGEVSHELEIVTETDTMLLPVQATVLTCHEYDSRQPDSPRGGKAAGIRLVATQPPVSMGIIRPHREHESQTLRA